MCVLLCVCAGRERLLYAVFPTCFETENPRTGRVIKTHTATHCNPLQHTTTIHSNTQQHTATYCKTLQHAVTHCNTLQHTATHCNTLQHTATQDWPRHTGECKGIRGMRALQYTATRYNILQHRTRHVTKASARGCGPPQPKQQRCASTACSRRVI